MNYLDYAATTPLDIEVYDLLMTSLKHEFANPNSLHLLGHQLREDIEEIRADFKRLLKLKPLDQFYFTSSATESNNTIIKGLGLKSEDVVCYSKADHSSLTATIEDLKEKNIKLLEIPHLENGLIDLASFEEKLLEHHKNIKAIFLTSVNNQTGIILNIDLLVNLIKKHTKAHIHVDAVQHFGKMPLFDLTKVDSAAFSAHKIYGPKSIAGLYIKQGLKITPLIHGGGQEHGFRSGTESIALIKAFHLAAKKRVKQLKADQEVVTNLKEQIIQLLQTEIPELIIPFKEEVSPFIVSLITPKFSSDIVIRHMERKEIYISSTSACSSKIKGFNSSLKAVGIHPDLHKNFLRISLSHLVTKEQITAFVLELKKTWNELNKIGK